ncbi:MAG: nucleotidyltransferase family protein [Terriglobales bacterium]
MRDIKAILLVGGLGTRLRSVVSSQPKVLASIGEKPFVELLVRQLQSQGIRNLVMCTGYLGDQIESKFKDGRDWHVSIKYSREDSPQGTAGALRLAQSHLQDAPDFLVLNGDSFLEVDFRDLLSFHRHHQNAVATLAVVHVDDAARYGTVQVDADSRITAFTEKTSAHAPGMINGGVYVFSPSIWKHIPEGPASLEHDVFPQLLPQGMFAHQQRGVFIDIGTPADFARAQQILRAP